ncbi:hypothetical protein DFH11DRAFT_1545412 [Phellopilus nigrolimitatus]|nr:hypothetical protein DFH11DRAFT_1545412 [Phellopilus nigrolimitatus]
MAAPHPPNSSGDCPRLVLFNNSLKNNAFGCDALGLHYKFSTPPAGILKAQRVTQISRRVGPQGRERLVAEWAKNAFRKDQLKMYAEARSSGKAEFVPVKDVLRKTTFTTWPVKRTFVANNGKRYTWKAGPFSMKLYCEDNKRQEVASFHRRRLLFSPRDAHIKLVHGYEDILDYIVVTAAVVESLRRERKGAKTQGGSTT